mmetsp:Transcript_27724/g.80017  ORF Transcript_27724/g.80017 Transcript_27724/m.80017 type:complete len:205 (+) Transcript_27724:2257-2871(+)
MAEAPILVVRDVGVDEKVDELALLGTEANGNVPDGTAGSELLEYFQDQFLLVGTEFHDGLADVFLGSIAEDVELGVIGPEDDALPTEPVKSDRCILEEVQELCVPGSILSLLRRHRIAVKDYLPRPHAGPSLPSTITPHIPVKVLADRQSLSQNQHLHVANALGEGLAVGHAAQGRLEPGAVVAVAGLALLVVCVVVSLLRRLR